MLSAVMEETLPDAAELVNPPARTSSVGDSLSTGATAAAAAGGASGGAAQGLSQPRPPYTLREGVGMRRLLKFRVAAGVQLLLVQAASEMYAQQYQHLGVSLSMLLLVQRAGTEHVGYRGVACMLLPTGVKLGRWDTRWGPRTRCSIISRPPTPPCPVGCMPGFCSQLQLCDGSALLSLICGGCRILKTNAPLATCHLCFLPNTLPFLPFLSYTPYVFP